MSASGYLFVFEGADGVGKTTLSRGLYEHLQSESIPCQYLAFPGKDEGTLGKHIYDLHHQPKTYNIHSLDSTSLQLLHVAAHIDAIVNHICPALERGEIVILDRFWWSTYVYGTVAGIKPKLADAIIQPELMLWGNNKPTTVFVITRNSPLHSEENLDQWHKLCANYYELANREKKKYPVSTFRNGSDFKVTLRRIINEVESVILKHPEEKVQKEISSNNEQLTLGLFEEATKPQPVAELTFFLQLAPAKPTQIYNTYWNFAAERQSVFFGRVQGQPPPWTGDPILKKYKFTNAYRASDRVSQYLIRHVIYTGEPSADEVFFRILMFKIFNNIQTWEYLTNSVGEITYEEFDFEVYDKLLTQRMENNTTIFSAAYIMPSGGSSFGFSRKHRNYLKLLEKMMLDDVPARLCDMKRMRDAFELLRSYPMIGDFLAYQYVTDINYSEITDFSEMDFVVAGPGALSGISKCFSDLGGLSTNDIIRMVTERQQVEFDRLDLNFQDLWGRPLQLIDCQNLFCEVDKYSRVAHPDITGVSKRTRIKQKFKSASGKIKYWYPPKWDINKNISNL